MHAYPFIEPVFPPQINFPLTLMGDQFAVEKTCRWCFHLANTMLTNYVASWTSHTTLTVDANSPGHKAYFTLNSPFFL